MKRGALAALLLLGARTAEAAPSVAIVDEGEKILLGAPPPATLAPGAGPLRLVAARNETVAFQVVVSADDAPLEDLTVDVAGLHTDRFVELFLDVPRASGGKVPGEAIGWAPGSAPTPLVGKVPDPLAPVSLPSVYPLRVAPRENGIVWVDVPVDRAEAVGLHRGEVTVRRHGATLATVPVELEVVDAVLPERPVRTMLAYGRGEIAKRTGSAKAERHFLQLLHRHRIAPMIGVTTASELGAYLDALNGPLYTPEAGYDGPAEGMGDGVVAIGPYGSLGAPDAEKVARVAAIAAFLDERKLFATTDVFLYAADEDCGSELGARWKAALAASTPSARKVRVGWTCALAPAKQPVDVVILPPSMDPAAARAAREAGKTPWVYNGHLPETGSFLLDAPLTSPRVNGWLAAVYGVERWFYWESTLWYDDNKGGKGPYDPLARGETFHNADGDWAMGDGVLVYPGTQVDVPGARSLGFEGVLGSMRLASWRRGIEDAGIYQLAHAAHPAEAEAIAREVVPRAFSSAKRGARAPFPEAGKPWADARRKLLALIPKGADGGAGAGARPSIPSPDSPAPALVTRRACGCRTVGSPGDDRPSSLALGSLFALAFARLRATSRARRRQFAPR